MVTKIRKSGRRAKRLRIGAPDGSLTSVAGLVAVRELVGRLGVIGAIDAAVGPIKARARGCSAGQLLVGIAAAQLAGEEFLVGLDRQRGDAAGQALTPVPGLASTTALGLARRMDEQRWCGGGRDRCRDRADAGACEAQELRPWCVLPVVRPRGGIR